MDECESLLGGFVADRARRCDIMFPEGETTTLGFELVLLCCTVFLELVDSVGEEGFGSVGVGGVMKVVGASDRLGGVAGSEVMMRFGATDLSDGVDLVSSPVCICGGEAWIGLSNTFVSCFLPPNRAPSPPPLVLGLAASGLAPGLGTGDVALRFGVKASLSLPTGDTPRLFTAMSLVFALRVVGSSMEAWEFTSVPWVELEESIVSEAIRGDDRVKRPACDWCGEMPGRLSGGGLQPVSRRLWAEWIRMRQRNRKEGRGAMKNNNEWNSEGQGSVRDTESMRWEV
jgi:hypothetical protein